MFFDLNIVYDKGNTNPAKEAVNTAGLLGYNTVALNYTVRGKPGSPDVGAITKFTYEADASGQKPHGASVDQLTRLTLVLDDNAQGMLLTANSPLLQSYDIIAVQPGTDALLLKCCQSTEIDIISFDLSQRLPVKLRPAILAQAVDHGIYFEVCLSQALKDALSRRIFISNVTELVKVTRGKNIMFSSGASSALNLRAPYDFINLGTIFGIEAASAKKSLTIFPRSVTYHAKTRKTERGMIQVSNISDLAPEERWKVPKEPENLGGLAADVDDDAMDIDEKPKPKPQQQQHQQKPSTPGNNKPTQQQQQKKK